MNLLNRFVDDVYTSWLGLAVGCCAPSWSKDAERAPARGVERPMTILHHQPQLIPPPIPESQYHRASSREGASGTRSLSTRASFSVRGRLDRYASRDKPQISGPSDFRHVQNGLPRRMERFRPLELSIYMPENRLSPILPHLGAADADEELMSYPPAVLMHVRSESALSSFAIPRKPLNSHSVSMGRHPHALLPSSSHSSAAKLRYKPLPARPDLRESLSADDLVAALQDGLPSMPPSALLRANTEPIRMLHRRNSEQVERVKSILHEKVALEGQLREIDSIIEERRSLYMSSRPASIYEESEEPMPDPTASPSLSFSRPKTAPSRPTVHIPLRSKSFSEASAAFTSPITPPNESLPPPLPLTLQPTRPPLRKKKSFSHISHWLFPGSGGSSSLAEAHARNISLDSVTNMPRPVTARDGFYQCVDPHSVARASTTSARSSISTVSTLETDRGELVTPPPTTTTAMTMMTAWTPESSPRPEKESVELTRMTTFGRQKVVAGSCEGCRGAIGRVEGDDCCRVSGVVGVAF